MGPLVRALLALALLAAPLSAFAALVNINTADATLLDTLPGVGPTKAAAIVTYRESHGPFAAIEDIKNVSGIGPVTFSKLSALITVDASAVVQPTVPPTSSQSIQTVVSGTSPNALAHVQKHTAAPREVGTATARGAAAPVVAAATDTAPDTEPAHAPLPVPSASSGLFSHTTWLAGLVAIVALAGGAFMIL